MFSNRLMFPITNIRGKIVGFSGRALDKSDNIKYVNSPETPIFKKGEIIYQLNEASMDIRRRNHAILYEGFLMLLVLTSRSTKWYCYNGNCINDKSS